MEKQKKRKNLVKGQIGPIDIVARVNQTKKYFKGLYRLWSYLRGVIWTFSVNNFQ